jgi:beta-N-acetylhexosaminidase
VTNYLQGLKDAGIMGCIKHFPGHGDTKADTHFGYAQSTKTWDEMLDCEMVTFRAGIKWGCQLIMTAHIAVPNVTGSDIPSTMSSVILQDKLRGELGQLERHQLRIIPELRFHLDETIDRLEHIDELLKR